MFAFMEKYYTPEIEEFHVGFGYERCDDGYGWIKDTYPRAAEHIRLKNLIPYTRVKYLDREDIESLGFEKCKCPDGLLDNVFQLKTSYETKYVVNFYQDIDNRTGFTQIMQRFRHEGANKEFFGERTTLFKGTIKNKSELKKLLKQLGM